MLVKRYPGYLLKLVFKIQSHKFLGSISIIFIQFFSNGYQT